MILLKRFLELHKVMLLGAALFVYSLCFRLYGVDDNFWLMGDQIRDWNVVAGSFAELPLHGTPRVDGGFCYGPIFYWVLWLFRHGLASFFGNLPHIAAYGFAVLHAAAEVCLFKAMLARGVRLPTALVVSLALLSSAGEACLFSTLWNPNLAIIFAMTSLACLVARWPRRSIAGLVITVSCAVLAVHAHMPALFMALPTALAAFVEHAERCSWPERWRALAAGALAMAVAHLPLAVHMGSESGGAAKPSILATALADPSVMLAKFRGRASITFLFDSFHELLVMPLGTTAQFAVCLMLAALAWLWRCGWRDPLTMAVLGTFGLTWVGWGLWTGIYVQYWLVAVQCHFALLFGFGLARFIFPKFEHFAGGALLALLLFTQPARWESRQVMDRFPTYGVLVRSAPGLVKAVPQAGSVSGCNGTYQEQAELLYRLAGGQIDRQSSVHAEMGNCSPSK